jgi:hypothetical protein
MKEVGTRESWNWKKALQRLSVIILFAPGNHDFLVFSDAHTHQFAENSCAAPIRIKRRGKYCTARARKAVSMT